MIPNRLVFQCDVHSVHISSIKRTTGKSYSVAGYVLGVSLLAGGCNLEGNSHESSDIAAFQQVVELDLPIRSVRWEVFGTPEYSIGAPGPTDFVTLIAEVPALDQEVIRKRSKAGTVWIAPEAARPWLSGTNRTMLAKHRNASVNLSHFLDCRAVHGKLRKTGLTVHGFVCNSQESALVYVTLG